MPSTQVIKVASRSNPTLITGCWFCVPAEGKKAWGDLWMVGDAFVFNATLMSGQTSWYHDLDVDKGDKAVLLSANRSYFERRGVIVCEAQHCFFNPAAEQHIQKILDQYV